VYQKNCLLIGMKEIYVASAIVSATAAIEAFGLYFIRAGGILNTIKGALFYGLGVAPFLSWAVKYEGIGIVNFIWNILSTLIGFAIGVYIYKEKVGNMQIMGVVVSLLGLGMILLDPDTK
jgi:multidrug transporter EmrE-like cation transporter